MASNAKVAVLRLVQEDQRRFGELDLLAKLGHGGMADVFLAAVRAKPSELVVLKRLKEDLLDAEHRSMFEDEARIMPQLSHPNVVRTLEYRAQEGWPYLAMEFLDGLPLDQCWQAVGDLGEIAVRHVVCELLEGLHYAHELRSPEGQPLELVHRDVSPQNVFVTYDGRVTLVDFGIAKSRGRAQHTSTGVVRGKLSYMAPEQALCDTVDRRADIFSAGVLLYELATGSRFWGGLNDVQILKRMTFGDLPKFEQHEGSRFVMGSPTGEALAKVIRVALQARPEDRYGTAREFRHALADAVPGTIRRTQLGAAVEKASQGYREALRALVDEHLLNARGTAGLVGVDPLAQSGERVATASSTSEEATPVEETAPGFEVESSAESSPDGIVASERAHAVDSSLRSGEATDGRREAKSSFSGRALLVGLTLAATTAAVITILANRSVEPQRASASAQQPPPEVARDQHIELKLGATREETRVFLDNAPIDRLPFTGKLRRDGAAHTLRAEAPGYVSESRIVVFDRDVDIVFSLQPERPARPSASALPVVSSPNQARPWPTVTPPKPSANGGFDLRTPPWGAGSKGPKK